MQSLLPAVLAILEPHTSVVGNGTVVSSSGSLAPALARPLLMRVIACHERGTWTGRGARVWAPTPPAPQADCSAILRRARRLLFRTSAHVVLVGDSLSFELFALTRWLVQRTPQLQRRLTVHLVGMPVIPRSVKGIRRVLHAAVCGGARVHPNASRARPRVVVINAGLWYNDVADIGAGANVLTTGCGSAQPNHEFPGRTTPTPNARWAQCNVCTAYAAARRCTNQSTRADYQADVAALARVLSGPLCRQERPAVLWRESTPQHYPPRGPFSDSFLRLRARRGAAPPCLRRRPDDGRDWRNLVAGSAMRRAGLPVIPLEAALAVRGADHPGNGDCTHWRAGSASLAHISRVVLDAVGAAAADTADSER